MDFSDTLSVTWPTPLSDQYTKGNWESKPVCVRIIIDNTLAIDLEPKVINGSHPLVTDNKFRRHSSNEEQTE